MKAPDGYAWNTELNAEYGAAPIVLVEMETGKVVMKIKLNENMLFQYENHEYISAECAMSAVNAVARKRLGQTLDA